MMNEGRSIVALVEVDTVDVIEAVVELFEDEHQRALGIDEIFFNQLLFFNCHQIWSKPIISPHI